MECLPFTSTKPAKLGRHPDICLGRTHSDPRSAKRGAQTSGGTRRLNKEEYTQTRPVLGLPGQTCSGQTRVRVWGVWLGQSVLAVPGIAGEFPKTNGARCLLGAAFLARSTLPTLLRPSGRVGCAGGSALLPHGARGRRRGGSPARAKSLRRSQGFLGREGLGKPI